MQRKKIIHIITGLGKGGAENMLYKLLKYSDRNLYYHEVISLGGLDEYGDKIKELGIVVHTLEMNKKNLIRSLKKSKFICKDFDIIDTWLYHADFYGYIIAKILLRKKLIWNVRHSNLDKNANKKSILNLIKINSFLSKRVDSITYNSSKALKTHKAKGYNGKSEVILPNGFELDKFKFNEESRDKIRKQMTLEDNIKVIITVGRWNVQKDYETLIKALNDLRHKTNNFKLIMVGENLDSYNSALSILIDKYNMSEYVILLGIRENISSLLSAADIYISSSLGESFSNSIGEAMSCELDIVSTNAGDSELIIGDTGSIVNIQDYKMMSKKLYHIIKNSDNMRNKEARKRIIEKYKIQKVVNLFEENYKNTEKLNEVLL